MGQTKQQFSTASKPRCSHNNKNFLPARDFEAHAGITGISAHYVFPRGMSVGKYEAYLLSYAGWNHVEGKNPEEQIYNASHDPLVMARLRKDWAELVALNPELKKISINKNDGGELRDALFGAASQFNIDDINIFLDTPRKTGNNLNGINVPKIYGLKVTEAQIELTSGVRMQWVASPETVNKIKAALEAKTGKPLDWVLTPENQEKITSFIAQKWNEPTDTPEQTEEIKTILAGPVEGWTSRLNDTTMKEIKNLLYKAPAKKKASGPKQRP